jgi:nitrite reductase (NO-forming)
VGAVFLLPVASPPSPTDLVAVTAGAPAEFVFTLSQANVTSGPVSFEVRNAGVLPHDFAVCSVPTTTLLTSCEGTKTALIPPGASATLSTTFTGPGTYEYLCTVPGHAPAGMKGTFAVG